MRLNLINLFIVLSVLGIIAAGYYRWRESQACIAHGGQYWCNKYSCVCLAPGITIPPGYLQ